MKALAFTFSLSLLGASIYAAINLSSVFWFLVVCSIVLMAKSAPQSVIDAEQASLDNTMAAKESAAEKQNNIICSHCQERGQVATRQVRIKRGISGAKATAAVLTGGISVLGTGLSRKETATEATCAHCGSTWHF